MFFKRLEIIGFKSFGDKTIFEFEPGITTIVGPNGCGKSNVADAIRWVLGEQSPKSLRGGKMDDVIFSGTDQRAAINMAEVSFTIEDPHNILPVEFHEVTITRRVFRDGQSEYLLNKAPCRLKDIQEIFLDTGIITDDYAILEQGKMDRILNAKPTDRREIFEAASGIAKYKARKAEALRKLEHAEENLVRVTDIVKEVKRQIQSVQRYAAKARQYRAMYQEMKDLEIVRSRHHFEKVQQEHSKIQEQLQAIYSGQEEQAKKAEETASSLQAMRAHRAELLGQHEGLQQEVTDLDRQYHHRQSQAGADEERLTELNRSLARWAAEIREHEEKIARFRQESELLQEETGALQEEVACHREAVGRQDARLREIQEQLRERIRKQKEGREIVLEAEFKASRTKNDMGGLEAGHRAAVLKKERLLVEKQALAAQIHQQEEELSGAKSALGAETETVRTLSEDERSLEGVSEAMQGKVNDMQAAAERLREELAKRKTEAEMLRQWKERSSDLPKVAQRLLFRRKEDPNTWSGLMGRLTDLISIDPGYEAPVETVLGAWAGDLVVSSKEWLGKVRKMLGQDAQARLSVVCTEKRIPVPDRAKTTLVDPRIEGPLSDFVRVDQAVADTLKPLLDAVYVVGSWEDAQELGSQQEAGCDGLPAFVTHQGECVWSHGRSVVGSEARSTGGVFERQQRLLALSTEVQRLQRLLHEAVLEKGGLLISLEEQRKKVAVARELRHREDVRCGSLNNELEKLEDQLRLARKNLQVVTGESAEAEREEERFTEQYKEHETRLQELEALRSNHRDGFEDLEREIGRLGKDRDTLLEEVTHKKIKLASSEEKLENRLRHAKELTERLGESEGLFEAKRTDSEEAKARVGQLEESLRAWEAERVQTGETLQAKREALAVLAGQRRESQAGCARMEEELSALQASRNQATDRQRTLEVQRAQLEAQRDHVREDLMKEFQVDLLGADAVLTDEVKAAIQEKYREDWTAIETRVAEIRRKVEGMGPVNVEALNEHEELQTRYDFLVKQHEDLMRAKQDLLKVISRINTTSRQLFADTFAKIRKNFQEIFVQLFGGGKADLLLTDENDLLESGIDIVARPPGKQLRSISLMSGGEKSLTAIALMFAVFKVKPSPFSILDEIDAPLDESNIGRFVGMLRDYCQTTQFIVITHSKRTISEADVLYGITMQESGVSKVVSVRMTDAPRASTSRVAAPQGREVSPLFDKGGTATATMTRQNATSKPSDTETPERSPE